MRAVFDTVVLGGELIDGSGVPRRHADLGISGGLVGHIGPPGSLSRSDGTSSVDASGLVACPGFIDIHTHLDAQILWDPSCTPSPLHGVTTVVGGNCGFTIAPISSASVPYLRGMLGRVEGIPIEALEQGPTWDWESFGDYLARVDRGMALNAGFLVGHSTLRRLVMGERAVGSPATADDLTRMRNLLGEALDAGALGFSSSWSRTHQDANGDPVPSRSADAHELVYLSEELRRHPGTTVEFIPNVASREPFDQGHLDVMTEMSLAAGRPLNWNILLVTKDNIDLVRHQLSASDHAAARGGAIFALALPDLMHVRYTFLSGFGLDTFPGWARPMALAPDEKIAFLSDPARRSELEAGAASQSRTWTWGDLVLSEGFSSSTRGDEGRRIGEIAADTGRSPFDVVCDAVVADRLRTVLMPPAAGDDADSWGLRGEIWRDPRVVLGASDTGAHLDMLSTFNFPTAFLGHHVRDKGLMSLEEGVHRLTQVQARLYGISGRGHLTDGAHADIVVFDPDEIGPEVVHTRQDLPGGASRLYGEARGIHHVLVNGAEVVRAGALTGELPGTLMRSGRDTHTVDVPGRAPAREMETRS